MKKNLSLLLLLLLSCMAQAQNLRLQGSVRSGATGEPLPYVNIGIRNKNLGTATDAQGKFILTLPRERAQDTLTFSAIGYKELSVPVAELAQQGQLELTLHEKPQQLQEVVVKSRKLRVRKLGVTGRLPMVWGNPEDTQDRDVYEFANLIQVKERPTDLLSAHFYLSSHKLDSVLFRINFYKNNNGVPGERLVEQSIVQQLSARQGWVQIDLRPYNIVLQEDFFLGIEYLPASGTDRLALLLGAKLGGNSYSRKSSLGKWDKFSGASLSGYVTVQQ